MKQQFFLASTSTLQILPSAKINYKTVQEPSTVPKTDLSFSLKWYTVRRTS